MGVLREKLLGRRDRLFIALLVCSNCYTLISLLRSRPIPAATSPPPPATSALATFQFSNITQRTFIRGHGMQGFVFFSAYRLSADEFVVLGLSPLILHRVLVSEFCRWKSAHAGAGYTEGAVVVEYPGEAHQKMYEVVMLFCKLESPTAKGEGGHLRVMIDREEVIVYGEPANNRVPFEPQLPYKSQITYCSQPIYGDFNEIRVMEWIEFHRIGHGVDRFHIYAVGPVADSLIHVFKPYMTSGVLTLADISEVRQFENWFAQVLAMNDCLYRSRLIAKWVLFLDLDEYLFVDPTKGNLQHVLSEHEGQAWVSFGSEFFFTKMCSHSLNISYPEDAVLVDRIVKSRWEVERLIFKQSEVHCVAVSKYRSRFFCLGFDGHRKYVADPRQIIIAGIHSVTKPTTGGVDLDAREVHLNHYRGLNTNYIRSCRQFIHDSDWIPKTWKRDFSLSRLALHVRKEALMASFAKRPGYSSALLNATVIRIKRELLGGGPVVGAQEKDSEDEQ